MSDDFQWNKDNDSIVVASVQGIAIYPNTAGGIIIRVSGVQVPPPLPIFSET